MTEDNQSLIIAIQDLTRAVEKLVKVKQEGIELAREIEERRRSHDGGTL